jgi:hypothetical protein
MRQSKEAIVTIRSVLCVLNGSPEEINTLNSIMALAGLDQSTMRLLLVPTKPGTLADIDSQESDDADISRAMASDLLEASRSLKAQNSQPNEHYFDDESEPNGNKQDESFEKKLQIVLQVTGAIMTILHEKGECSVDDLVAQGFTPDEIALCWDVAEGWASINDQANRETTSVAAA